MEAIVGGTARSVTATRHGNSTQHHDGVAYSLDSLLLDQECVFDVTEAT